MQMEGCLIVKGEEPGNAARVNKLSFSQTICKGVVIKDGLARSSEPESIVRLNSVTTPITDDDLENQEVLDAIDSAFGIAEIILRHSLTVKQTKVAWSFVKWLETFIVMVSSHDLIVVNRDVLWHLR